MLIKLFEDYNPKEGGCVFILTNKYDDGYKRIYVSPITNYIKGDNGMDKVKINPENMILIKKEGGSFIGKSFNMSPYYLKLVLNMNSEWITLNNNKTPFWRSSIDINLKDFIKKYKVMLNDLTSQGVVFKSGKITVN